MRYYPLNRIIICFILVIGMSQITLGQNKAKIKVLIIDGFSNHDWKQTTALTKWILERSGKFEIDISTIPLDSLSKETWKPEFEKYAVVIQNTNNIQNQKLRWPRATELALERFVKNGGGLYILHSGNNAYPHWEEYDKMIGLGWRPKSFGYALSIDNNEVIRRIPPGEGLGTGHGDRFNALITLLNRHPINKGFPKQWQTANTEVYHYPRGVAENITVLSYAFDSTGTKQTWPVEWAVKYGKGRVYNSSMGHLWKGEIYPPAYRCVGFQTTMIRAAEWLATGKVSYPIPKDFPSKDTISLKPETEYSIR